MKHTLLAAFLLIFGAAFAQCTIDNDTSHYHGKFFYPDTPACIVRNAPYAQTIYMRIPRTVMANQLIPTLPAIQVTVDSIHLDSIMGLPAGITYAINPPSKTIYGGSFACIYLSGTTSAPTGEYPLDFSGTGCGSAGAIFDTCIYQSSFSSVFTYSLFVCAPAGISSADDAPWMTMGANPVNEVLAIQLQPLTEQAMLRLYDIRGTLVKEQAIAPNTTAVQVDMKLLPTGSYVLEWQSAQHKTTRRLVRE
ncbi:MAG: T9SS type A sorting domain-containing protein [Chitinophagales bacterium]